MSPLHLMRSFALLWALAGSAGVRADAGDRPPVGTWAHAATIDVAGLRELSGMTRSLTVAGRWWAHNDSGDRARLYAYDACGHDAGRVELRGVTASDWEDIAAFRRAQQSWLAIGDIGDNLEWRHEVRVLLLPEPTPAAGTVEVARVLRFRYVDGPRDAEALAVDVSAGQILILDKSADRAGLYALDLDGALQQVARRIADLPQQWPTAQRPLRRYRVTAMDLSADGGELAVLDERQVLLFQRRPAESWAQTLSREPTAQPLPRDGRLYEALAYDDDGELWIAPEGRAPVLMRLLRAPPQGASVDGASPAAGAGSSGTPCGSAAGPGG